MIAAFRDLQIGRRARRRDQARQKIVLGLAFELQTNRTQTFARLFENLGDSSVCAGPDDAVDFRNELLQLGTEALREAAGNDQLLPGPFCGGMLEDDFRRLGLGRIDERARVHHDGVRLTGVRNELPA